MRRFLCFAKNAQVTVGCTRRGIFVLDSKGRELARFPGYFPGDKVALSLDGKFAAAKSTEGKLSIINLSTMERLLNLQLPVDRAQDDGFCFSHDSQYLYNIESGSTYENEIVRYRISDLQRETIVGKEHLLRFTTIAYSDWLSTYCVLCFAKDRTYLAPRIIAFFDGTTLTEQFDVDWREAYQTFLKLTLPL